MCNRTKFALITRNDSSTCTYKHFYFPLIVLSSVYGVHFFESLEMLFFSSKHSHFTINEEGPNNGRTWPLADTVSGVTPPRYNFSITLEQSFWRRLSYFCVFNVFKRKGICIIFLTYNWVIIRQYPGNVPPPTKVLIWFVLNFNRNNDFFTDL